MRLIGGKIEGRYSPVRGERDLDWYVRLGLLGSACFLVRRSRGRQWRRWRSRDRRRTVAVETNVSRIQHPTGGVVGAILVKEGQRVAADEVLIRLDETATRANLQIVVNEMTSLHARLARLRAERDGAATVSMRRISSTGQPAILR